MATKTAEKLSVELPVEIFDVQTNVPLIHQVVVAQLAAARQGTHATKTRGEVRGGGKKPYKQKGTGRARQGSTRAPQFAGGGTVHGPQPRDYAQRTPKNDERPPPCVAPSPTGRATTASTSSRPS
jgi:LSU ribosomal protein L4P